MKFYHISEFFTSGYMNKIIRLSVQICTDIMCHLRGCFSYSVVYGTDFPPFSF